MVDHIHKLPVCGFKPHNPHDPSCAKIKGKMIACGTVKNPENPKIGANALCRHAKPAAKKAVRKAVKKPKRKS